MKKVIKPYAWMRTIKVGYMNPCVQKAGEPDVLLFSHEAVGKVIRFMDICAHLGLKEYDHNVRKVYENPDRYRIIKHPGWKEEW